MQLNKLAPSMLKITILVKMICQLKVSMSSNYFKGCLIDKVTIFMHK